MMNKYNEGFIGRLPDDSIHEPISKNPSPSAGLGRVIPAPDNRPTSLEAILEDYGYAIVNNPEKSRTELMLPAIAAIEALVPEKDTADYPHGTARMAMQISHNMVIDTILSNFKGGQ